MSQLTNIIESTSGLSEDQKQKLCAAFDEAIKSAAAEMRGKAKPSPRIIPLQMQWLEPVDHDWFETARREGVTIEVRINLKNISIVVTK